MLTIFAGLLGVIGWFLYEKPQPPFVGVVYTEETVLSKIVESETNYFKQTGNYWQGLRTNSNWNLKTSDGSQKSWKNEGINLGTLSFEIEVHEYGGPQGKGFKVFFYGSDFESSYIYHQGILVDSKRLVDEPIEPITASQ